MLAVIAAGVGLAAAGCGDDSDGKRSPSGSAASQARVNIGSFRFLPAKVSVAKGGTVTFTNHDKPAPHTATAQDASFDTGRLENGDARTIAFKTPGTFRYYCVYHRFMEADVVVR